ncbi:MAG TPA: hypothetical protein P5110_02410 [Candidatus Omnitrophota bacterium]|nr:hypothetical protein [Candidatus Omnitrophota bacterium]HRZ14340.1 hypothetical protein [Candidatus Omnitrophota bacterium]
MAEFNVYYDQQNNCLRGVFKGQVDHMQVGAYVKEVYSKATRKNERLLSDFREAQVDLAEIEIVSIREMIRNIGIDQSWKRAIVVSQKMELFKFFEVLCNNYGDKVRAFSDMDEALAWLKAD